MFTFAMRNLFRQRLRASLTLGAVATGVAALILAAGFVQDILIQLRESVIHSQLGHLQVFKAGYSASGGSDPTAYLIDDADRTVESVRQAPHVADAMRRLSFSALISNGRADMPVLGNGVEPAREAQLGSAITIIAGRQLTDDDADAIVLGEGLAEALRVGPGDRVTLLARAVAGALNTADLEVVGVFRSVSREFDAAAVRVPLGAAQDLLASRSVSSIVVKLEATERTEATRSFLEPRLSGQGLEVRSWVELADFYRATAALYERQFGVLQVIILFLVVFGVANSVNMNAFERTGEFGTLLATGTRRGRVIRLLLIENLMLGLVGGAVGVAIALGIAVAVSVVGIQMPPPPNAAVGYTAYIRIVPSAMVSAFLIGAVAVVAAAMWPAFKVTRLPIVEALRHNP